jgi:hypothetical protein
MELVAFLLLLDSVISKSTEILLLHCLDFLSSTYMHTFIRIFPRQLFFAVRQMTFNVYPLCGGHV